MHAKPTGEMEKLGRDYDDFDLVCDHLLAFDTSKTGDDAVIATYRLLREEKIDGIQNFYSSQEFDLSNMDKKPFRDRMAGRLTGPTISFS